MRLSSVAIILALVSHGYAWSPWLGRAQKEAGSITGRVRLDGKPAPGITIIATPAPSSDPAKVVEQMFNSSASIKATTDSDGVYRLEGVPAGKYRVAASAPALVSADTRSAGEITVTEDSVAEGVDFALSLGGVITGKITDSEGRPVIGESVSLKPLDKEEAAMASSLAAGFGNRMYATDDRGVYRIFGLRPGRYVVSAGKDSDVMSAFLSQRPKRVQTFFPSVTDETKAKVVQVTAGSEAAGVDIQFGVTDKGFVVSGRVVDSEKNTPIANAMVAYSKGQKALISQGGVVTDIGEDDSSGSSDMPGGFTMTNDKGEFRFASVAPGKYKLEAQSIGAFTGTSASQFYADPVAFEVQSTNVEKLDIKVHRGAVINGVVVIESADTQDSLDRFLQLTLMAMVTDDATKSHSSGTCVVGADGSFRLGGLKPGKVTIRPFSMSARRAGLLRVERNGVEVQEGFQIQPNEEITGIRVILTPATCVISGRVTITGGALQPGARVRALARSVNADPSEFANVWGNPPAEVSPNGSFVIENLTPGSFEVEVFTFVPGQRSRSVRAKQTVIVTRESPAFVDLVLDLSGKVSDK
ncbi:MAG TPA: carboxypeptidase-like regulatory domain-containing protein [Blastocatellia bacterium]|nr:carboxypeptidase-like regulatory domain-containing protein [Blastocatellia bacterium]